MKTGYKIAFFMIAVIACFSSDVVISTTAMIAVCLWLGIFIYEQAFEE